VEGATVSLQQSVTIGTPNSSARLRAPQTARVSVDIAPVRTERTIVKIPVRMRNLRLGESAQSRPASVTVTVRGGDDALRAMKPDDIEANVDLNGLGPGKYILAIRVVPSRSYGVVRIEPAQAEITIR
jgi:YbbR domain-containing protein